MQLSATPFPAAWSRRTLAFFLIVLLAIALELLSAAARPRASVEALGRRLSDHVPRGLAPVALGALVVVFAVELALVTRAAHAAFAHVPWVARLPIPVVYDIVPQVYRLAFAVLSVFEALLLGAFLLAAQYRRWKRADTIASVIAAAAISMLAVWAPVMMSADMYAYVGYALLGPSAAYAPPATPLAGEFASINQIWGRLNPAAYGPLWLWWNSAVVGLAAGLHAKLIVLRLVNVVALGVVLGSLRLCGVAPRFVAAMAANPAIAFYFITNGHNDLVVVAILLVAMTFAARSPLGAGLVAGIGASLKLSLIAPAATIALLIATLPRRFLYFAVTFFTAAAIALKLGGRPYLHALSVVAHQYSYFNMTASMRVAHFSVALVALVVVALAVIARRTFASAGFSFVALGQAYYPWYTIWALPYAATRNSALATLLVGFPLATALLDATMRSTALACSIVGALLLAIAAVLVQRLHAERSPVNL